MTPLQAFLVLALACAVTASRSASHCRCRPADACWPSLAQWQKLNVTLAGNLQAVRPVASICHDPTFDTAACAAVTSNSSDSTWRATEPGAVQWTNWEERPSKNESCYVDSDRGIPCGQGRISLFSVVAQNASHIQAAVRFARKHDLRLVIKNSGHCFLGRLSAPESLQIATHVLDSIQFINDFTPEGSSKSEGMAVTIGAGVLLKPLYEAVAKRNVTVVSGFSRTVGAAGGYIQGGGHSPLATWKGMASDNALEFRIVDAEGHLIIANDHRHPDLFWALRGGGGGTFGVVVSVTVRTFPEIPIISTSVKVSTLNTTGFWEALRVFHANLPSINDAGASGYYLFIPAATEGSGSRATFAIYFANVSNLAYANETLSPTIKSFVSLLGNASIEYSLAVISESKDFFAESLPGQSDPGGSVDRVGSRLISHDFLASSCGPTQLTSVLHNISSQAPGTGFTGHVVAGGKVARNTSDSAVNPAWRRTVTHIDYGSSWADGVTLEQQRLVADRITNKQLPLLRALEPEMGAYLNEADADEADWQKSFWGANYERLLKIKKKWDPQGLFITRRGVGSEQWDEDGLCRIHHDV